jgi:hypothetical protein
MGAIRPHSPLIVLEIDFIDKILRRARRINNTTFLNYYLNYDILILANTKDTY